MKANKLVFKVVCLVGVILAITGCEYDVAEPQWDKPYPDFAVPIITSINPATVAPAGINNIILYGENFAQNYKDNIVYFTASEYKDKKHEFLVDTAEIISGTTTSLTVLRPNLACDSIIIKLVSKDADIVVEDSSLMYQLDPVMERYGNFVENAALSALAVDGEENLYVVQTNTLVFTIPPGGKKTAMDSTTMRIPYDITMHPDGERLIIISNDSLITQMNRNGGAETEWASVWILEDTTRKNVSIKAGDFDSDENLYVAGSGSGLFVVTEGEEGGTALGIYEEDNVICIREYQGYLYLLVNLVGNTSAHDIAIWRHPITNGSLGPATLVFDLADAEGGVAGATINTFEIIENGKIFIGSNNAAPILIYDPAEDSQEILYKNIIPTQCKKLVSGNDHYLYMILAGSENNVLRLDIGTLAQ
jgi:hypothetical protein